MAEREYLRFLKEIEKVMGNGRTSNKELDVVGEALFGEKFLGAVPKTLGLRWANETDMKEYIIIINTQDVGGEHWTLFYKFPNERGVFYDSYGGGMKSNLGERYQWVVNTEDDAEQDLNGLKEDNCGQRCLAAACVGYSMGMLALLKI